MILLILLISSTPGKINFTSNFKLVYDNNIYFYSPFDLSLFASETIPEKFPINKVYDVIGKFFLSCKWRFPGKTLNFYFARSHYFFNGEKSYHLLGGGIFLKLWKYQSVTLKGEYTPYYLLRYYGREKITSSDTTTVYLPATYDRKSLSFKVSTEFSRLFKIDLFTTRFKDNYKRTFDEYDTETWDLGSTLSYSPLPYFTGEFTYIHRSLWVGKAIADFSYNRNEFYLTFIFKKRPIQVEYLLGIKKRDYTTTASADRTHYKRSDQELVGSLELTWRTSKIFSLEIGGNYFTRKTFSPVSYTEEIKSYERLQVFSGLSLYL